jgi:hypothetical protein
MSHAKMHLDRDNMATLNLRGQRRGVRIGIRAKADRLVDMFLWQSSGAIQ